MIQLLYEGQWLLFCVILVALLFSLSFHEFGHAWAAKRFGDDTAQRAGRLTLNPISHIDPMGLMMVVFVGFGYAKPVPTDPRRFTSRYAEMLVAAAGPAMNLLLAVITVNIFVQGLQFGWYSPYETLPPIVDGIQSAADRCVGRTLYFALFSTATTVAAVSLLQRTIRESRIIGIDSTVVFGHPSFADRLAYQRCSLTTYCVCVNSCQTRRNGEFDHG